MNKTVIVIVCIVFLVVIALIIYFSLGETISSQIAENGQRKESVVLNKGLSGDELPDNIETWTPTEQDLTNFEKAVFEQLKKERKYRIAKDFDNYKCQYTATIKEDGTKIIFGNYFIGDFENWQTQEVLVLDGGENFFQATYNFSAGDVEITVNGQA